MLPIAFYRAGKGVGWLWLEAKTPEDLDNIVAYLMTLSPDYVAP